MENMHEVSIPKTAKPNQQVYSTIQDSKLAFLTVNMTHTNLETKNTHQNKH